MKEVKKYLTEEQVDKQEHLSKNRLDTLAPYYDWYNSNFNDRPKHNLIDLMHWVRNQFGGNIDNKYQCG